MFSKDFLNTLSKLNSYTNKVVLKYPQTVLNSDPTDVIVNINAQELGCSEFPETGVYELSKLISMLDLFENPQITRTDKTLEFQTTTERAVFTLCDLELLKDHNQSENYINAANKFPTIAEFTLSVEELTKIKKASSILSELNALKISGQNSNTTLELSFHNRFNSSNNTYKKEFLGTSNGDFSVNVAIGNFNKLPQNNYIVKVYFNAEKNSYRVIFEAETYKVLIGILADS